MSPPAKGCFPCEEALAKAISTCWADSNGMQLCTQSSKESPDLEVSASALRETAIRMHISRLSHQKGPSQISMKEENEDEAGDALRRSFDERMDEVEEPPASGRKHHRNEQVAGQQPQKRRCCSF
uniref:Uncharacterized protein n=1 Tax=Pinguiococcus pyrenoidosus TaxID=172671 RepID=A0A6U0W7A7_9STRA|mmetsp:Transcript_6561/g.25347  ORF Transcript_6561/g.25347 Transcript_6561/m.25347 type:complete len:125 (+) Transcript_6561:121-495(+)|eukprot:scaffold245_cov256-Pinguiococcus_pyrenoidosus.AAC.36